MLAAPVLRRLATPLLLTLCACPAPMMVVDSGVVMPVDAGAPVACAKPESCRDQGYPKAVCREGFCNPDVLCGSDFECSLGERCTRGRCVFTGCTKDADCPTGRCLADTYSCVECAGNADCPRDRPVCDVARNTCTACRTDAQCTVPGPARCGPNGSCVHCLVNDDCPNGLTCGPGNLCTGVRKGQPCPMGTACGAGLSCVTLNGEPVCLPSCNLYQPQCETGELCYRLTYATSNSLVFESQGPIGVCFRQQAGLRGPRELCQRNDMGGSNCQPNLQCVPETATTALCRTYCNPLISGGCVSTEKCVSFPGDFNGRRYGLCLPDTGFGASCVRDDQCRANLSCQPYDDPSSSNDVSNICQYNVGAAPGLAPCADRVLADGGVIPANVGCRSGACRGDPLALNSPSYFCYHACEQDQDCAVGGRTGICDADFTFTTAFGTVGTVRGCRPACTEESSCSSYDAGVTCRVRLVSSATEPKLTSTCSPASGQGRSGEPCTSSVQCRSGFCQFDDARGARRQGACLELCSSGATCSTPANLDGGIFRELDCLPLSVLVSRGFDGVANTSDDRVLQRSFCAGRPCATTDDCRGDAGVTSVCAPMLEPGGANAVSLRCLPRTVGSRAAGESCLSDVECRSGVCGTLQSPSSEAGSRCFEACTATSTCPPLADGGVLSCRIGGMRITTSRGLVNVDSCAP